MGSTIALTIDLQNGATNENLNFSIVNHRHVIINVLFYENAIEWLIVYEIRLFAFEKPAVIIEGKLPWGISLTTLSL